MKPMNKVDPMATTGLHRSSSYQCWLWHCNVL